MRRPAPRAALGPEERRLLRRHLRAPVLTFLALAALLALQVALGALRPVAHAWIALAVAALMAAVILLVSMEVAREPPLVRLFSGVGFFFVAILIGMTLTDYLAR